ncbi:unnamed protein product [Arctia plantaginis]|uniref:Uncharacterized protein n=1 Tax=Arctia plantaginis TaxID=874455 RepID=A0A8S0YRD5_ARCPL|nr:unnamed protein product [Arctia plantaginis]CAB3261464.1 unnamed protein product [Arctia plantaginis]
MPKRSDNRQCSADRRAPPGIARHGPRERQPAGQPACCAYWRLQRLLQRDLRYAFGTYPPHQLLTTRPTLTPTHCRNYRALVEAGSHGRDLSDGCDIPKYPRIKRLLDCCDVQRPAATPHSCYLSNLAVITGSACVPQCTRSSPVTAAAPSRYHFAPIDQVYRDTHP